MTSQPTLKDILQAAETARFSPIKDYFFDSARRAVNAAKFVTSTFFWHAEWEKYQIQDAMIPWEERHNNATLVKIRTKTLDGRQLRCLVHMGKQYAAKMWPTMEINYVVIELEGFRPRLFDWRYGLQPGHRIPLTQVVQKIRGACLTGLAGIVKDQPIPFDGFCFNNILIRRGPDFLLKRRYSAPKYIPTYEVRFWEKNLGHPFQSRPRIIFHVRAYDKGSLLLTEKVWMHYSHWSRIYQFQRPILREAKWEKILDRRYVNLRQLTLHYFFVETDWEDHHSDPRHAVYCWRFLDGQIERCQPLHEKRALSSWGNREWASDCSLPLFFAKTEVSRGLMSYTQVELYASDREGLQREALKLVPTTTEVGHD